MIVRIRTRSQELKPRTGLFMFAGGGIVKLNLFLAEEFLGEFFI